MDFTRAMYEAYAFQLCVDFYSHTITDPLGNKWFWSDEGDNVKNFIDLVQLILIEETEVYDYKANGINLKFKHVEIGEYFKEDRPEVIEVFQKTGYHYAIATGGVEGEYFAQDFPIVLVDYS